MKALNVFQVQTLGDSDDDDLSASAWIAKSRKIQTEKEQAEKRAKMLEEMDQEFGIGNLVEEEFGTKKKDYTSKDLRGLKVQHDQAAFKEGQTVILTLQDKRILDEDGDQDTLENVNIIDNEKAAQNVENKLKRPEYKPWDEPEYDEYGMLKPKNMLEKYDEEIYGKKKETFTLDKTGKYDTSQERRMEEIRDSLKKQGQTLQLEAPQVATEYYTQDEMMAKFKKVKKKVRKIRKKPKATTADDLLIYGESVMDASRDHGSRRPVQNVDDDDFNPRKRIKVEPDENKTEGSNAGIPGLDMVKQEPGENVHDILDKVFNQETHELSDVDDTEAVHEDLTGIVLEPDEAGMALESALHKARKVKQMASLSSGEKVAERVATLGEEEIQEDDNKDNNGKTISELPIIKSKSAAGVNIVLNSTSEFCRALGDIPTYGMAGNRIEDQDELMDFEQELIEERKKREVDDENRAGWTQVEIDTEPVDIKEDEGNALDDEPVLNEGVGAALLLAQKKGYIESDEKKSVRMTTHTDLLAKSYTIEDKRYDDLDEKYSRKRDRFQSGITMEFKELDHYKPDVKLEYIDEGGRSLNEKEAFRQLSHRFHGKGSGKRKTEKRMKKLEEENLMKQMSSTDTPLGTVNMLQQKQRAEKSPYIVLSGSKSLTANSVAKH